MDKFQENQEKFPKNLENKWITYILGNFSNTLLGKIPHFKINILFPKELGDFPQKMDKFQKNQGIFPKIERISESHMSCGIFPIRLVIFPKSLKILW